MATFKSTAVGDDQRRQAFLPHPSGTVGYRIADVDTPNTLASADVLHFLPVFKGERLLGLVIGGGDLDTDSSPTIRMDVGYAGEHADVTADPDAFLDNKTVGQSTLYIPADLGLGHVFAEDDMLIATLSAGPGTSAAGTTRMIAQIGGRG